tara:strand:+ start:2621 stop:3901 length:1281 start_codon:yes stop_codon:yes gene_type:complete
MLFLYKILTNILYPFLILYIYFRKLNKKEHPKRFKEKIYSAYFNCQKKGQSRLLWFHAASIGELNSILPVIHNLNSNNNLEFLVTTSTYSSGELAKKEFSNYENIYHRFLPLDVNFLMSEFLKLWKPNVVFLVDSEIWPNLILQIKKQNISLALINARITSKTFNRWNIFIKSAKKIFSSFDFCLAANRETKLYLERFNCKNIKYNGNIKLANKIKHEDIKNLNEIILTETKFWFAASTHEGEDILCLKTHINLKKKFSKVLTIIAPRHISRVKKIKNLCDKFKFKVQILNDHEIIQNDKEIIIINSFGVLNNYYKFAKSVFIGKSTLTKLKSVGGQNPIDAAKLGCKIYHGPYVYNFKDIYEILEKGNISKMINDENDLSDFLIKDLESKKKNKNDISIFINELGEKTFVNTMKNINTFLLDEAK